MQEEEKKEFVCDKCGLCCKCLAYSEDGDFLNRGDGVCKYLDETTNLCKIYDFRPEVCRVDKMYKRYKDKMTWNQYVDMFTSVCDKLKEMDKAKKFREMYPNKLRYNDVFEKEEEEEILIIDDKGNDNLPS